MFKYFTILIVLSTAVLNLNLIASYKYKHTDKQADTCIVNLNLRGNFKRVKEIFQYKIPNNINLLGIGEVTHGGYEPIKFKVELIKYLISCKGFNTLLLEYPDLGVLGRIRGYINSTNIQAQEKKTHSCAVIIRGMSLLPRFYQDILIELIDWIRLYNLHHKTQVGIYGIDFLYKADFYNYFIKNYIVKVDSSIAYKLQSSWAKNKSPDIIKFKYIKAYFTKNENIFHLKNLNISHITLELNNELNRLKYLSLKWQDESLNLKMHPEVNFRDSVLAENIKYLSSGKKAIIWGHNNHIINKIGLTGGYLKTCYKDKYYSIITDYSLFAEVNVGDQKSEDSGKRNYIIKTIQAFKNSTSYKLYSLLGISNCIIFNKYFTNKQIFLNEIDLMGHHYLTQVDDNSFDAMAIFDTISTR
ncbi:erythromycin esterase family protein [Arachidicoccus ginsenosidivorans]|uniref:Erythromycin esterase family protein n=1 Tax=Arachidicoccus ginsenosidivorans TaxID=496057 RepID=A0A5B8VMK4_9BACT|nr:erythromycin esterase family protein [Arachidicoccus ginsenosidivorans]QEC72182.1 erythromycin esterase family protein [Arachidicoccus ginsenosidivorans]